MATPQLSVSTESTSIDPTVSTDGSANNSKVASPNSPPPYWSHVRNPSLLSQISVDGRSGPIRLQDNTEDTESSKACWAKAARVDDYVVITGNAPGLNDYIVWNCFIDTLNGGFFTIRKRYSEFDKLRRNLEQTFPNAGPALPPLPPKSTLKRFQPKFLEKRKLGLSYFLSCVLLNPEFSASPVVRDFLIA